MIDRILHSTEASAPRAMARTGSATSSLPPFVALVGPTAAGKSAVAVRLAAAVEGEVVALDSMQVYRHLNIGTAKPTPAEQQGIPHHLMDVVDPADPFTAADYARHARRVLNEIHARGRFPLVAGGSGLYLRALCGEIFSGPSEVGAIRARLREEIEQHGLATLYARLTHLDPCVAARVHPRDAFRLIRALEIIEVTGRRVSDLWEAHRQERIPPVVLLLGLRRERATLYRRINDRVDRMVAAGLVEEVRHLLEAGYAPDLKPFRGHNYRHVVAYLLGKHSFEDAVMRTKQETRHYAKRQLTWFRADKKVCWFDVTEETGDRLVSTLAERIKRAREDYGTA